MLSTSLCRSKEKSLRKWTAAVGAVVTAMAIVVGSASSASATTTPQLTCDKEYGSRIYHLFGTADYVDHTETHLREWKSFRYMVRGGEMSDNHNNVNIRVSKLGYVALNWKSPDNLEFNRWYTLRMRVPVYTSLLGPNGERDHRTNHVVEMTGIFDYAGGSDPRCTASKSV